jgi:hypothetical protein
MRCLNSYLPFDYVANILNINVLFYYNNYYFVAEIYSVLQALTYSQCFQFLLCTPKFIKDEWYGGQNNLDKGKKKKKKRQKKKHCLIRFIIFKIGSLSQIMK